MTERFIAHMRHHLDETRAAGLWKEERIIASPQGTTIDVTANGLSRRVINLCANNYLGLAGDPRLVEFAKQSLDR